MAAAEGHQAAWSPVGPEQTGQTLAAESRSITCLTCSELWGEVIYPVNLPKHKVVVF